MRQIISFFCSGSITTRLICKMYFSLRILFILCKRNTVDRLFFFFFLYVQKFLLVLTIFFFFKSRSIRHKVPARILKEKFVHTLTMVNRDVFKIDLQKIFDLFRHVVRSKYGNKIKYLSLYILFCDYYETIINNSYFFFISCIKIHTITTRIAKTRKTKTRIKNSRERIIRTIPLFSLLDNNDRYINDCIRANDITTQHS